MSDAPISGFADYLARYKAGTLPSSVPTRKPVDLSGVSLSGIKKPGAPADPLSFIVDMLSRPLYAVTETVDSALDMPDDAERIGKKFQSGDVGGGIGEVLGTLGKDITAPVRGLLSTNKDDKHTTSDLLEKGFDQFGKSFYGKDKFDAEKNNLPDVFKGIVGFGGDVLLDPTTYIPGAQIAKIGQLIGKGAKTAAEAGKGAAEAAIAARKPAEAAQEAAVAADPVAEVLADAKPVAAEPPRGGFNLNPKPLNIVEKALAKEPENAPVPEAEVGGNTPGTVGAADEALPSVPAERTPNAGVDVPAAPVAPELTPDQAALIERLRHTGRFEPGKGMVITAGDSPTGRELRGVVESISDDGHLTVKLEGGETMQVPADHALPTKLPHEPVNEKLNWTDPNGRNWASEEAYQAAHARAGGAPVSAEASTAAHGAPVAAEQVAPASLGDLMRSSERAKPIRDLLDRLRDPEGVKVERPAAKVEEKALSDEASAAFSKNRALELDPKTWAQKVLESSKAGEYVGKIKVNGQAIDLGRALRMRDASVQKAVKERYESWLEDIKNGEQVDHLGNPLDDVAAEGDAFDQVGDLRPLSDDEVDNLIDASVDEEGDFTAEALVKGARELGFGKALDDDAIRQLWDDLPDDDGDAVREMLQQALGHPAEAAKAVEDGPVVKFLENSRQRFEYLKETQEEMVTQVLGSKLVQQFARSTNPERFDKTIASLSKVLDDMGTLDDLDLATLPNKSAFLNLSKRLGVEDPEAVLAQRAALQRSPESTKAQMKQIGEELAGDNRRAEDVMPGFLKDNFGKDHLEATYPLETDTGVKRTDEVMGVGLGRDVKAVNTHAQMDLWNRSHEPIRKAFEAENLKLPREKQAYFEKRWSIVAERAMKAQREHEAFLERNGVPLHIDYDNVRKALKLSELYDTLAAKDKWLADVLFHSEFATAPTLYAEATVLAMRSDGSAEALQAVFDKLISVAKRNGKEGDIPNWLTPMKGDKPRWGKVAHLPNQRKPPAGFKGFSAAAGEVRFEPNASKTGFNVYVSNDAVASRAFSHLIDSAIPLAAKASENADAYAKRFGEDIYMVTDKVLGDIQKLADDPDSIGAAITAIAKKDEVVNETAGTIHARHDATEVARIQVEVALPPEAVTTATTTQKIAEAVGRGDQAAVITARAEHTADSAKETQTLIDEIGPHIEEVDLSDPVKALTENVAVTINGTRARLLDPIRKSFHAAHGMTVQGKIDLFQWMRSSGQLTSNYLRHNVGLINALPKKYPDIINGQPVINLAFERLKSGVRPPVGDPLHDAFDDMNRLMTDFIDVSGKNGILGNQFLRSGVGLEYLDEVLRSYDILDVTHLPDGSVFRDSLVDLGKAKAAHLADPKRYPTELAAAIDQWREWPIKNPLDFMRKLNAASLRVAGDVGIVDSFVKFGTSHGFVSKVAEPGMVKLTATGKSHFGKLLPADIYVDREVAEAFAHMDKAMAEPKTIPGSVGHLVHNYLDPVLQAWKFGITQPRPGHHIRNIIGDESMTYFADGVKFQKRSANDAFRLMSLRSSYQGVDIQRALNNLGEFKLTGGGDILSKGKFGNLSANDLMDAMQQRGLLADSAVVEDLYQEEGAAFSKWMKKLSLQGGRVQQVSGQVSEYREHYTRMKHFLQIVHKAQETGADHLGRPIKDTTALLEYASKRVMKYHPDVSMLSNFEKKYVRRVIPFYTWMRGALPAMVESTLLHPARTNVMNKASYNLAVAMGVNPDSLSDPFPTDQLFPSFLTEQMQGPQFATNGGYFAMNPGISSWDIANTFAPDPVRGVLGMVNPLIRVPAELMSGGSWGTGAKINDKSDYVDSSTPFLNYLANMSGYSPTGSVASVLTGNGLDPQYQHVPKKDGTVNKDAGDQALSALNWLTGLGISNYSKPNYINQAEIEKRNAASGKQTNAF